MSRRHRFGFTVRLRLRARPAIRRRQVKLNIGGLHEVVGVLSLQFLFAHDSLNHGHRIADLTRPGHGARRDASAS
jgi:hypothetical protein